MVGMYGPDCKAGGEDAIFYEKIALVQLLRDCEWTVISTWTNDEDNCEFRTWRVFGGLGSAKTYALRRGS